MDLKLPIFLCLLFAVLIKADDLQCTGCLCAAADNSATFARGDTAILCIQFITVNKTTSTILTQRAAYPVAVDTFSSVQLQGGQPNFMGFDYVSIVAQVHGTVMSTPLTYIQTPQAFYATAFSIVIQISSGVIQSVVWDHRCATCESSDCFKFSMTNGTLIDTICNNSTCQSSTINSNCDPQVYVSWVGSDKNGDKMNSAGMRLSRFRQFSTSDLLSTRSISSYVMPTPSPSNSTNSTNSTTSDLSDESTNGNGTTNEGGTGTNNSSTGENSNFNTAPATPPNASTGNQSGTSSSGEQTSDQTAPSLPTAGNTSNNPIEGDGTSGVINT